MVEIDQTSEPLILVSPERAARILEIYGADPARWPRPERAGTLAALNEFPELAQARQAATDIDKVLDTAPGYTPSADLARRVSAAARHDPPLKSWRAWAGRSGAEVRHPEGDHAAGGHAFRGGGVGNYGRGFCPGQRQ